MPAKGDTSSGVDVLISLYLTQGKVYHRKTIAEFNVHLVLLCVTIIHSMAGCLIQYHIYLSCFNVTVKNCFENNVKT